MKIRLLKKAVLLVISILCIASCTVFNKQDKAESNKIKIKEKNLIDEEMKSSSNKFKQKDNVFNSYVSSVSEELIKSKPEFKFKVGEETTYSVKLWTKESSLAPVNGYVSFKINKGVYNRKECYIFKGIIIAYGFGYKLKLSSESYVDSSLFLPLLMSNIQSGTESRKSKMVFFEKKIEYREMKHCESGLSCQQAEHCFYKNGIKFHCENCMNEDHYVWNDKAEYDNNEPVYDLLSSFFIARNFELKPGLEDKKMKVVDGCDLWELKINITGEEAIETEIGIFNTVALQLSALPLNEHARQQKVFKGLFGLEGDIRLWVDKETNIPIRIRGVYPLRFDFQVEIMINSIENIRIKQNTL